MNLETFINLKTKEKDSWISETAKKEMTFQRGYQSKTSAARKKAWDVASMEYHRLESEKIFGKKTWDEYGFIRVVTDFYNNTLKSSKVVQVL